MWQCTLGGGQKNQKCQSELALQLFPFSMVHRFQKHKDHLRGLMGSAPLRVILFGKRIQRILKMYKWKKLPTHFSILFFWNNFVAKSDQQVWLLWSRRLFRHQDKPYRPMSCLDVICAYDIKGRIWHQNMTFSDLAYLGV